MWCNKSCMIASSMATIIYASDQTVKLCHVKLPTTYKQHHPSNCYNSRSLCDQWVIIRLCLCNLLHKSSLSGHSSPNSWEGGGWQFLKKTKKMAVTNSGLWLDTKPGYGWVCTLIGPCHNGWAEGAVLLRPQTRKLSGGKKPAYTVSSAFHLLLSRKQCN